MERTCDGLTRGQEFKHIRHLPAIVFEDGVDPPTTASAFAGCTEATVSKRKRRTERTFQDTLVVFKPLGRRWSPVGVSELLDDPLKAFQLVQ
jgi:hypothetical protein